MKTKSKETMKKMRTIEKRTSSLKLLFNLVHRRAEKERQRVINSISCIEKQREIVALSKVQMRQVARADNMTHGLGMRELLLRGLGPFFFSLGF